jgi:formate dehydrogenase subunit gamma
MRFVPRLCLVVLVSLAGAALAQQSPAPAAPADPAAQSYDERIKAQQQRQVTQPGNNAPVWREVRQGQSPYTNSTVQGRETNVLVQSWGETWRQIRNGPVTFWGGWMVLAVLAILAALYFAKGPVKLQGRPTGRLIHRFTPLEQVAHWCTAISFCVLGLSGLIMLFGKHVLLPIFGYTLFAWLTALGKNLHNFVAPVFMVAVLIMIVMWLRDNLPRAYDFTWFAKAWRFFLKGEHIPSGRFNAGEKGWFWIGVVALSVVVSWSGLILLFPNFDQTRAVMQTAWIWHAVAALIYIAISLGHIYMGTIGVEGSYRSMREGQVDETWAREHHEYWYNDVKSGRCGQGQGCRPAQQGGGPRGRQRQEERQGRPGVYGRQEVTD